MSGGGKNQGLPGIKSQQPEYLKNTTASQQPAFMPGQEEAIANQLSAGFGQSPQAWIDQMNKIYAPAQTLNFGSAPAASAAAATAAAAAAKVTAKAAPAKQKSSAARNGYTTGGYNDSPGFFVHGGTGGNAR
jgi:hypothetical protein